ncbi:DUF5685 family protein [Rubritalea spongiae]|uniref:DUF5685 family protein n=1 Tax=Rubritalea spongiae TaxID=430797 RepID=A0ABW5E1A9_9BACT
MFGFTRSPASCCQKASHSLYKSFFCGLSCRLKNDYGHSARFLVNRDSTFLTLLGASLAPAATQQTISTCCNPLSTPCSLTIDSSIQQYSAAITICGLTEKCKDDTSDHVGWRKFAAGSLHTLTRPWQDRAINTLNSLYFPTASVQKSLKNQHLVETPSHSIAEAATPTAQSYQTIFEHLHRVLKIPKSPELAIVGFNLGQLIYLRDAVDDLPSDRKNSHYNPLLHRDLTECQSLAEESFQKFNTSLRRLPLKRHHESLLAIAEQTTSYHNDLIHSPTPKTPKKKKERSNSCWDRFDCFPCDNCCCDISSSSCDCGDSCCGCDCCSCGS